MNHNTTSYFLRPAVTKSDVFALLTYLGLSIGNFGFLTGDILRLSLMTFVATTTVFLFFALRGRFTRNEAAIFLTISLFFLLQLFRTSNLESAVSKFEGAVLASIIVFALTRLSQMLSGDRFEHAFVRVAFAVLALTVVYKMNFGFIDREVRFFLNGPIVFGWLMGIAAIICVKLFTARQQIGMLFVATIFFVAVYWSGSKGPLIALFCATGFIFLRHRDPSRFVQITCLALAIGTLVFLFPELVPPRFYAIQRVFLGQLIEDDFGSIGARLEMWSGAIRLFAEHPVVGIGLGNWSNRFESNFTQDFLFNYPHNIILEVLSEHGSVGAILFLFVFWRIFSNTSEVGKVIFVFSLVALLFSGHAAYWMFLIGMPLGLTQHGTHSDSTVRLAGRRQ